MGCGRVAVIGSGHFDERAIALRAVETIDFMTAQVVHLSHKLLETVSNSIINELCGVSHVIYDVSKKLPATFDWEYGLSL